MTTRLTAAPPRVLAVITARGGSKGVPRKNIRLLGGSPLIVWSIRAGKAVSQHLHSIVVSTDDEEIASIARDAGADVPFLRPSELAGDQARSLPVIQHATRFVEERDAVRMDWVLLLQPTTPFRTPDDIVACLDLAARGDCDSVVSVTAMDHHPVFAKKIDADGFLAPFMLEEPEGLRRQDATPPAFVRNGAIYLTRRATLMDDNSIYGARIRPYVMPRLRSVNIDTELDFLLAETVANHAPG